MTGKLDLTSLIVTNNSLQKSGREDVNYEDACNPLRTKGTSYFVDLCDQSIIVIIVQSSKPVHGIRFELVGFSDPTFVNLVEDCQTFQSL